jgi:RNA polymerase sigma-70 factor (ECF subfamily)
LLIRIRDAQDREAWEQFVEIYAPLVFGYVRKQGLQHADAADVTQEVLGKVHRAIRRLDYDRQQGRFRGWLLTITRNTLRTHWTSANREPHGSGDTGTLRMLDQLSDADDSDTDFWQQEYCRCVFRWAARRIQSEFKSRTWQAFWQTTHYGVPPKQVAVELGMSLGAVYTAKSRVIARLRDEIERIEQDELAIS